MLAGSSQFSLLSTILLSLEAVEVAVALYEVAVVVELAVYAQP
jgi:hypothetical protein